MANRLLDAELKEEEALAGASERASIDAERDAVKMLSPTRTPVPGAGFLQFEQQRRAAVGR